MSDLLKKINLLYVEDDMAIQPVLAKVLERKVNNLYIASDGLEGYEKYLEFKPDIILTDIKMPKMNGIDMSRKIKEQNKDIPIIVTSAHSEAGYLLESIELGIDAYLLKPIDRRKLLSMLESNAKIVLYEREKVRHQKLLQAVIDLQPSIIFSVDDNKKTIFTNKLFFDIFSCDSEDDSVCKYESVNENSKVKTLETSSNDFWLDYLFSHLNETFKISIVKNENENLFLVKAKEIHESDDTIVIITLVEI